MSALPISSLVSGRRISAVTKNGPSPKTSPKTDKKVVTRNGRSPKFQKDTLAQVQKQMGDSEMGLNVDDLLASVREKLDLLNGLPPQSETGSNSNSNLI